MAHFYVSTENKRGSQVTAEGLASGQTTWARGWGAGVKVSAYVDAFGDDYFQIFATGGSGGSKSDVLIGAVHHDGTFHPAKKVTA